MLLYLLSLTKLNNNNIVIYWFIKRVLNKLIQLNYKNQLYSVSNTVITNKR